MVYIAYQNFIKAGGSGDLAVAKIKSDGTQVLAATYFGGTGSDGATPSIRVDSLGRPVVLSVTNSTDLPTVSAYDSTFNGANDMYIVKFNSNLSQPIFSTYLGGTGQEFTETHGLALDSQDNVIIGVTTTSPTSSIPIIGGIQTTYGGSGGGGTGSGTNYPGDGYVAKFSSTGSFLASTYYGGNFGEGLEGIGVDSSDNIYFSGATYSTNFPITSDALFTTNRGSADFFTVKLSPNLDQRLYSSYIGGSSDDYVRTSMADSNGNFYIAGQTLSSNFYTLNAYDSTYGGNALEDAVLIKLSTGALSPTSTPQPPTTTPTTPLPSVTPGGSTTVRFYSQAGDGRLGYFGPSNSGCGLSAQTQWDTAYNSLTAPAGYTDTLRSTYVSSGCLGNSAVNIARGFLPFDTSSLPDNVLITDAKMFINVNTTQNSVNDGNDFISVVQGLQSSPLSLIDTDYTKAGNSLLNPVEGSNRVDISSITPSAYNLWQLNSSGLSWISKTGSTLLALREGHDILNIWAGYNVGQGNRIDAYLSEQTGTTQDPYLEVTYTTQIHCPPLGNIDCQGTVSVGDLSYVISHFGSNDSLSDLNDSGKVNVIDLAILLSNFGQ